MKKFLNNIFLKLAFLIFFYILCSEKASLDDLSIKEEIDTSNADQIIKNADIVLTNDKIVTARVNTKLMKKFGESVILAGNGLKINFLNNAGDTVSILTAENGRIFPHSNNMEARENVFVCNNDSMKLYTQSLKWDNKKRIIYTEDTVKLVKGKNYLRGRYFEASADLKTYTIKQVTASTFPNIGKF